MRSPQEWGLGGAGIRTAGGRTHAGEIVASGPAADREKRVGKRYGRPISDDSAAAPDGPADLYRGPGHSARLRGGGAGAPAPGQNGPPHGGGTAKPTVAPTTKS